MVLDSLLRDGKEGRLYVFHDNNQAIYQQQELEDALPEGLVPYDLTKNCRNTDPIHALFTKFYTGEGRVDPPGVAGLPVEMLTFGDQNELENLLGGLLRRLVVDQRMSVSDLIVLTPRARARSFISDEILVGGFKLRRSDVGVPDAVQVSTIHRFKGLERRVTILVELDDEMGSEGESLLYVGLSRAQYHAICVVRRGSRCADLLGVSG